MLAYTNKFWTSDADNWSNLFGRRTACKDRGLSGKELRDCMKDLRTEDKGLSYSEKRDRAIDRKIGVGLATPAEKPITEDTAVSTDEVTKPTPAEQAEMIEQTRMAQEMEKKAAKRRTGMIIGVSVGAIGLVALVWYLIKRRKG